VTVTAPAPPPPLPSIYYSFALVAFENEEFGPYAWATGGIFLAIGCYQTHCLNLLKSNNSPPPPANAGPARPKPPANPAQSPGPGWEWRGNGPPGSSQGSWYNPSTGESLHPDLSHPDPIGPHWDYRDPSGNDFRIFPDGSAQPK
jgi:hypothetical protein